MKRIGKVLRSLLKRNRVQDETPNFPLRTVLIAPSTQLDLYSDVAKDFVERIFEVPYESVFMTDRSELWDFWPLLDVDRKDSKRYLLQKIERIYGIDVSDIKDGNMVKIFERLV